MLSRTIAALLFGAVIAASTPADALQCVPFARDVSGISIRGDAWTWWSSAAGSYDRGHAPRAGAVVVFQKTRAMRHGHVAVVTEVVNSREVLVDHANWGSRRTGGRGQIAKGMSVVDISPRNDWTQVRVWNRRSGDYGTRVYPTYGFIYAPGSRAARVQMASYIPEPPKAEMARGEQSRTVQASAPQPAPVAATVTASAPMPRLSQPGDQMLATADLQIASVLSDNPGRAAKVESKALAEQKAAPAEAKPSASVAEAPAATDDQILARRFGSGRY
ncbi:MAG TPA: CHAP domain-containing protein [Candidatus Sulfotelmatobacter sp.]|nr:CHAP domain-containing protein [Candidatus Sulfotelmatobacter sp.]